MYFSSLGKGEKARSGSKARSTLSNSAGMRPLEATESTSVICGSHWHGLLFQKTFKENFISHYLFLGCAKVVNSSQTGCLRVKKRTSNWILSNSQLHIQTALVPQRTPPWSLKTVITWYYVTKGLILEMSEYKSSSHWRAMSGTAMLTWPFRRTFRDSEKEISIWINSTVRNGLNGKILSHW